MTNAAGFFGMHIVERDLNGQHPVAGSIVSRAEVVPGLSGPLIGFRQINGQWKIEWGL
jgi:hypothetical protein